MAQRSKYMGRWMVLAAASVATIVGGYLILTFPHPPSQASPTITFIGYTNTGGQTEALFRFNHPPRSGFAFGLHELSYHTSTGWAALPSAQSVSWRYETGLVAAISVETTNLPARVVVDIWTPRKGVAGLCDHLLGQLTRLVGETPTPSQFGVLYLTNQTVGLPSNP